MKIFIFILSASLASAIAGPSIESVKSDARQVCKEENFNSNILLALLERESDFGATLNKNWKCPNNFGCGVAQIDVRYHKDFLDNNNWRDTKVSCRYAIKLLRQNLRIFKGDIKAALAAYNCGAGNVKKALKKKRHYDLHTTGKNYSVDVIRRARKF